MEIPKRCVLSSSQEVLLRHSHFLGDPEAEVEKNDSEDSGERETPKECTGIMMMSPPESSDDNDQNGNNSSRDDDVFQTPPEGSLMASSDGNGNDRTDVVKEDTAHGCTDGENAVNLGADTDVGFSEVESQKFEGVNEVIHFESNSVSALKRESVTDNKCLSGSLLKKPKLLDENLVSESPVQFLDSELGENKEKIMKSLEKSNSNRASPCSCGSKSPQTQSNQSSEGSSVKRKLRFTTEVLELETEVIDRDLRFREGLENNIRNAKGNSNIGRKNMDDINKFRYVGPSTYNSCQTERKNQGVRALPVSVCGQPEENAGKESDLGKNRGEITLLDVLRMLAAKCDYDSSLENRSILDVAKSRGMTFS
ncbi:hypothetical protein Pint_15768 [Pistacia integerrima]|uniref:Uncharacterized protein n=1 Tax=Pistacia integerrima TaxID=434235 RepID=A0ACC0Z7Z6_9ROSI|nr:hypothetical protein Pint_15768 [Pistacia integerrima]